MNWSVILKGLAAAAVGGAVSGAGTAVQNRMNNVPGAPPITGANVGISAGLGALMTAVAYLIQSPLLRGDETK